ncbi:MAG TPA: FKBP-type peptidyl-prolyl cis-trans isomerase [Pyrinomonadaceae bacterium]|jgi:peptidylprolyl isomerase
MPQSRKRQTSKARRPSPQINQNRQAAPPKRNDKKTRVIAGVVIAALLGAGLVYLLAFRGRNAASGKEVTTASGLKYVDLVEGTGPTPQLGQTVVVHYTGTLQNGTKFDSSVDKNRPFSFPIGRGSVIKGWDEGLMTMKVGGKRKLIIPPKLGYGNQDQPNIPANSTLIFDVEMLGIK